MLAAATGYACSYICMTDVLCLQDVLCRCFRSVLSPVAIAKKWLFHSVTACSSDLSSDLYRTCVCACCVLRRHLRNTLLGIPPCCLRCVRPLLVPGCLAITYCYFLLLVLTVNHKFTEHSCAGVVLGPAVRCWDFVIHSVGCICAL